jgi:hypothetical protein
VGGALERRARPGYVVPVSTLSPTRQIIRAEALAWLAEHEAPAGASVITSLPNVSELPVRDFDAWRTWFVDAAERVLRWLPSTGVAMFYQSDIRHAGVWVDKSYLVMRAAEAAQVSLLFHKIVCRKPPGTITHGRASYSHLLGFARAPRPSMAHPGPDVLADAGAMPSSKSMGVLACRVACRFLREETDTRTVVDPFCGHGTALAVANAFGFDAIGIDTSARQCRAARALRVDA